MLTLLSPAKKLNFDDPATALEPTEPRLAKETARLAKIARKQTIEDLKRLMHLSDSLAELNVERFAAFDLRGRGNSIKPAALAFDGDVYGGLDARSLDADDLAYAQGHLRILSGLYGVLRPLDAIQAHRLEMGTKLPTERGRTLYDFWGTRLSDLLKQDAMEHEDPTVVNLASNEYFKAVDRKALGLPVIGAKFLELKDGKARALMYYAKQARGAMARWIVTERIERAADLRGFSGGGYSFDPEASTDSELVFTRPQPPTKG